MTLILLAANAEGWGSLCSLSSQMLCAKEAAYFIFVLKYAQLAKDLGFLTCERGSSSASLVHYALGITTLDPIKWGLYFERFLNPERCWSSVPDLDLDIEGEGRLRVMEALEAELGSDEQAT